MGTTGQMLITAGAVLSAGILLLTTYNRVYRWTLRQKAQDRELSAIRKENTLLTYGVLACLKGLEEQGCDCGVLACTELSVFAGRHHLSPFYTDAMAVLAQRAVQACRRPLRDIFIK